MPEMFEALEPRQFLSASLTPPTPIPAAQAAPSLTISATSGQLDIAQPVEGSTYMGGSRIRLVAFARDGSGSIPNQNLKWIVAVKTDSGTHRLAAVAGKRTTGVRIPPKLNGDPTQFVRVTLIARNANGRVQKQSVVLKPQLVNLNVLSTFPGINVKVDGQTPEGPVQTVAGMRRTVAAPRSQTIAGATYVFDHWSDGGRRIHRAYVEPGGTTLVAVYRLAGVDTTPPSSGGSSSGGGTTSGTNTPGSASAAPAASLFGDRPILA